MDGNGRWAENRGLPVAEGHRAGTRALRRTVEASIDLGVESLAVYAFSTENWTRPTDEVDALMGIFEETIERELPDLAAQGVQGALHRPARPRAARRCRTRMAAMEAETAANDAHRPLGRLRLRRPGGARRRGAPADRGRDAAGRRGRGGVRRALCPIRSCIEPDLLIRTSGEQRISNFLLWQLAYSELVFVDRLWPDFDESDLHEALGEYARRRRRFGGR